MDAGADANAQPNHPVALTAEQAEILLKADLRNLAKKVQQGKTLSAAERNILQSSLTGGKPSPATYARNQVELAEILGVSRWLVQRQRKAPGNPGVQPDGRYDVNAWRLWLVDRGTAPDGEGLTQSQLRARQILLQNQKLEFQLAILRREYVPSAEVERWGGELGGAIRKVVATIHLCAPCVVGVSVAEAEARLKEVEDEVLQQLHLLDESISRWRDSVEPAV
jgi:hypothetical protein